MQTSKQRLISFIEKSSSNECRIIENIIREYAVNKSVYRNLMPHLLCEAIKKNLINHFY